MTDRPRHRPVGWGATEPLLRRYLPPDFYARLPRHGQSWRGRTVLLLWGLGYPLEMAWSLGLTGDPEQAASYREVIVDLTDEHLIDLLDATAARRGDGSHLTWASFGLLR